MEAVVGMFSMFFAGLILLIPHRIGMSRVNYVIKRYNLPISRAGLLLYKYHNNIELSLLHGTFAGNVLNWSLGLADTTGVKIIRILMIFFLFFMLLSSIYMFIIYISGGDFGHLNAFYFSLIFLTLFDGFANAFAFALNAPNSSLLSAAAIPLSGFLVTLFHYIYKFFSDLFHWDDFDYYVLRLQLLCNILTILAALILWIYDTINKFTGGIAPSLDLLKLFKTTNDGHIGEWSPIGMLAISLGTVYAFYPSIAPYSIIDFQYASIIELWILIISAILPLTMAILDMVTSFTGIKLGPSGLAGAYDKDTTASTCPTTFITAITYNWNFDPSVNQSPWWHFFWICAIFYILCIQIFMSMLHYPHCLLSCFFNKPLRTCFISVLFNTLREALQALGFAGAGKQVTAPTSQAVTQQTCGQSTHDPTCPRIYPKWSDNPSTAEGNRKVNGSIAATNKLITLFVMMFCVFTGDGYLQHYRRCCRDCWPTTGYTKYQSFFYWLRFGFKGGIKSITSSFTDLYYHNLRPQFISYA